MVQVCEGTKTKNEMLIENVERYKEIYLKTKREFQKIVTVSYTLSLPLYLCTPQSA